MFVIIFFLLPFIGYYLFVWLFDCFFGSVNDSKKDTYITHIHNDNRQVHFHDANLQQTEVQEHHHK